MKSMDANEYNEIAMTVKCDLCGQFSGLMCKITSIYPCQLMQVCHSVRYDDGLALQEQMQLNAIDETA